MSNFMEYDCTVIELSFQSAKNYIFLGVRVGERGGRIVVEKAKSTSTSHVRHQKAVL